MVDGYSGVDSAGQQGHHFSLVTLWQKQKRVTVAPVDVQAMTTVFPLFKLRF